MIQDKLATLRKHAGMSQQEVADAIGVTRQTISNWELGQGSPTLDKAAELARLYGVSLDDLANNEVDIVSSERKQAPRDLHVMRSFVGKTVTIELADKNECDLSEAATLKEATVLDVSESWMRIEQSMPSGKLFGASKDERKRVVRLIDMADIVGVSAQVQG